jgi:hypothetical protein
MRIIILPFAMVALWALGFAAFMNAINNGAFL